MPDAFVTHDEIHVHDGPHWWPEEVITRKEFCTRVGLNEAAVRILNYRGAIRIARPTSRTAECLIPTSEVRRGEIAAQLTGLGISLARTIQALASGQLRDDGTFICVFDDVVVACAPRLDEA